MMNLHAVIASCLLGLLGVVPAGDRAASTLVRFPSASATQIAFVAHGDLWTAARDGGPAELLVQSAGRIVAARFSPDGRWIAYTERAHGGQDAYVIAAQGGAPRRLTFDALTNGQDNLVVAWTPDSRRIVFLSERGAWAETVLQAFSISLEGGAVTLEPLGQSGLLSFSPDGASLAYTRTFTDLASRKRYVGGQAEDIYTYGLADHRLTRITDWKGTDTAPMWSGRRIYFVSDRGAGFRANIWRYDLDAQAFQQVTRFTDYDVDRPALGGGRILFQQGGRLWALEVPGERLHEITVDVPDDRAHTTPRTLTVGREVRRTDVTGAVDYALSPNGAVGVYAAHGDLFALPTGGGAAHDLTATPAIDEDHPAISPDGRMLAYITEAEGAQQVAARPLAGGPERLLTHFPTGVLYAPSFSPDGTWLAVADAEHELWLVARGGGAPHPVAFDAVAEIRDAVFSADGHSLAYSTTRLTGLSALHLYDVRTRRDRVISTPLDSDRLPAFSADGRVLYFVSKRHELPLTTDRGDEATLATLDSDGIYGLALAGDPERAMARAVEVAAPAGRIVSLETRDDRVFAEVRPPSLLDGELPGLTAALYALDPSTGRDQVVVSGLDGHVLSADGRHALFVRDGAWRTADFAPAQERAVDLSGLSLTVDPRAEWREMFEHAWRLDRDLFFSRVMNGSNWTSVHDAYARLLPAIGSRDDFLYLLQQMQGELATSHAVIVGLDAGDRSPAIRTPRLGADLMLDEKLGRYRIATIYAGDPTRERFRSPLNVPALVPGVRPAQVGDFVLAMNGRELVAPTDPDALLVGLDGEVQLSLASRPDAPRRIVRVLPVESDLDLRQHAWIDANRRRVDALSKGRIGYVFLSDFEALGNQDLFRQLQGQLDKDGLVVDARWNRGGFTSQAVLDLLKRVRAGAFVNREGAVTPLPLFAAPRAMAVVVNAETASDGDQFAYFFKAFGLGPVIGERTWGGVQGVKGPWRLMDGTRITIPKDSLASVDGHWLIENAGVDPDIPVERRPDEIVSGRDSQLDRAVEAVLAQVHAQPVPLLRAPPSLPAYPKSGDVPGASF